VRGLVYECSDSGAEFHGRIRDSFPDSFKVQREKRKSLDNVIVKVSCNPSTFLLVYLNQLSADT